MKKSTAEPRQPVESPPAALATETLSLEAFARAAAEWNELVRASHCPVPFLSHQWLSLWWQHFGADLQFQALVVRDGPRLAAAVPLALRTVRFAGARVTIAEIAGTGPVPTRGVGLADKADLLVRRDRPQAGERLSGALLELFPQIDLLDIKGCDEHSPTAALLAEAAPRPRSVRVLERSLSPYLTLATWDAYLDSRSGNFRRQLRKHWRRLHEIGHAEVVRWEKGQDCAAWMAEVLAISQGSWTAARGTDLFRHPRLKSFFLELAAAMASQEWLDLHVLRVGGRAVAYELCLDFEGRVFSYNSGYRQDFAPHSPGTLVTAAVIENACARGRTEYDLLRGEEGYKSFWSQTCRRECQVLLPAARLRARMYAHLGPALKSALRKQRWLRELDDRVSGMVSRWRNINTPPTA